MVKPSRTIAALYIDPRGPYVDTPNVDAWDRERDATRYDGPYPIVAHPACGPWGNLRHMYRGGEGGPELAIRAVQQVRTWGGVLEHPAFSLLWPHCGLPRPGDPPDAWGGFTVDVNQCDWGHCARKRTWLYLVGVEREIADWRPPPRKPTHWISGGRALPGKRASQCCPPGIKIASERMRKITPIAFAEWLTLLAESVRR